MTGAELAAYCLGKPGAWADEPWEGVDESYGLVVSRLLRKHRPPGWDA